jgi:hypothetical protein
MRHNAPVHFGINFDLDLFQIVKMVAGHVLLNQLSTMWKFGNVVQKFDTLNLFHSFLQVFDSLVSFSSSLFFSLQIVFYADIDLVDSCLVEVIQCCHIYFTYLNVNSNQMS